MGYYTYFGGHLEFDKQPTKELVDEINAFADKRHCDPVNTNVTLDYAPSLWNHWRCVFYQGEWILELEEGKAYNYLEWFPVMVERFLDPHGLKVSGCIEWFGDESDDRGCIQVEDNAMSIYDAVITFKERV
jgi:hypothetical protein